VLALALSIPHYHEPFVRRIVIKASDQPQHFNHSQEDEEHVIYVSRAFVFVGGTFMVILRAAIPLLVYWRKFGCETRRRYVI
jgi:hypothetical protein